MVRVLNTISLLLWGFLGVFSFVLVFAMMIPESYLAFACLVLGLSLLVPISINLKRIVRKNDFDLGWFLAVKNGYWRILVFLTGLFLSIAGSLAIVVPQYSQIFWETYAMFFVKILTVLFWLALICSFLGWQIICLSESVIYVRIGKIKRAFSSFGLGLIWLFFAIVFSLAFLNVINDVFFRISNQSQSIVLGAFSILSIVVGLIPGFIADTKYLEEEDEFLAN